MPSWPRPVEGFNGIRRTFGPGDHLTYRAWPCGPWTVLRQMPLSGSKGPMGPGLATYSDDKIVQEFGASISATGAALAARICVDRPVSLPRSW